MAEYIFLGLIISAGIAFLPASIAKRKGKDFVTWYIYGFLLWIIAIFHAISLPEPKLETMMEHKTEYSTVKSIMLNNRVDINSPVDILGYSIDKGSDNTICLNIKLRNLNFGEVSAIKFNVIGYNSFGDIVSVNGSNTFQLSIQDLFVKQLVEFTNTEPIILPNKEIRVININVAQVCFSDGKIFDNSPRIIELDIQSISNCDEMTMMKKLLPNAICYPKYKENYWICACGYPNLNDNNVCSCCCSNKNYIFTTLNKNNILRLLKERRRQKNESKLREKQRVNKRNRRIKISALGIGCVVMITIAIYGAEKYYFIPNRKYNNAKNLLNNMKYDEAKSSFLSLKNYKESSSLSLECDYRKALKLIEDGQYNKAIQMLKTLEGYSDSNSILKKFTEEQTGEITVNRKIKVATNLSAELIYSPERNDFETVDASVTGYFIKGVLQGKATCEFTGSCYNGSAIGWGKEKYIYQGEMVDNLFCGEGSLYVNGHCVYMGDFENGTFNGNGKLYWDKSNQVLISGTFKNGNIQGKYTRYYSDGSLNDEGTCYKGIVNSNVYGTNNYN